MTTLMNTVVNYDVKLYPHLICNHGNWDIYSNSDGYCIAVPTPEAVSNGCMLTHFGDQHYVKATLGVDVMSIICAKS